MSYTLIESCAGGAALTLHLLWARKALLPYQGSKWRLRKLLTAEMVRMDFRGSPDRVVLTDPGPWGSVLRVVFDPYSRKGLIRDLGFLQDRDLAAVFGYFQGKRPHGDPVRYAAEFLFLQRLAFSGKAVAEVDGRWNSPGFNTSSAYGLAATERFGQVKPMLPSLVRNLESLQLLDVPVEVRRERASVLPVSGRTLVYIDPPYKGSTVYKDYFDTESVITLAEDYYESGASVIISERFGLDIARWRKHKLQISRNNKSPFTGKHEEWVTCSPSRE